MQPVQQPQASETCLRGLEGLLTQLLAGLFSQSLSGLNGSLSLAGLAVLAQEVLPTLQLQIHFAWELRWGERRILLLLDLRAHKLEI